MAKTTKTLKRDKNGKFLSQKTGKRGKKRRQSRKRGKKRSRRHSKKGRCSKSDAKFIMANIVQIFHLNGFCGPNDIFQLTLHDYWSAAVEDPDHTDSWWFCFKCSPHSCSWSKPTNQSNIHYYTTIPTSELSAARCGDDIPSQPHHQRCKC